MSGLQGVTSLENGFSSTWKLITANIVGLNTAVSGSSMALSTLLKTNEVIKKLPTFLIAYSYSQISEGIPGFTFLFIAQLRTGIYFSFQKLLIYHGFTSIGLTLREI